MPQPCVLRHGSHAAPVHARTTASRPLASMDALRALAILGVICLHTGPFYTADIRFDPAWQVVAQFCIATLALFAVPFFFAASGYFFGLAHQRNKDIVGTAKRFLGRVLLLIVAWNALYGVFQHSLFKGEWSPGAVLRLGIPGMAADMRTAPLHILLHGSSYQLWFLTALAMAALTVACVVRLHGARFLPVLAAAIYGIGLLGQSYHAFHWPVRSPLNTLVGPFFGTPLFTLGYVLSFRDLRRTHMDAVLICGGLALLCLERFVITVRLAWPDGHYFLGSVPLAAGLVRFAANHPDWLRRTPLPALGRLTLGVYAIHVAIMHAVDALYLPIMDLPVWQFLLPLVVYGFSIALVWLLARIPALARVLL
ncbi:MAG: acyltransferase [Desulfovibrionaceae bacterium]